ncbi:MAG: helix-turn-helix transcriptional regulator [Oscillospiraceae bacterium]|nr:helix-turn-helix transcriptional regulator [Oscillospiraceae bacterium]
MKLKNTNDLKMELMASPNLDKFLSDNESNFTGESIAEVLNRTLIEKNISKATLAKQSGISEVYLHQIFSGRRKPSRNRLLCLCYGLETTLEETQELLKLCGVAQLYSANRRDAILIFGIIHKINLFEINDILFSEDEETLF